MPYGHARRKRVKLFFYNLFPSPTGFPIESVSWLHNGLPLGGRIRGREVAGRRLVVEGVRAPHRGVYQCRVQGGVGETVLAAGFLTLGGKGGKWV